MTDVDQERLYEDYWLPVEQDLKDNLPTFFLDYINCKLESFTREKDAYDNFKKIYTDNGYTNESMLSEILHYAKQYKTFLEGNNSLSAEVNDALKGLQKLKQTTVYLFLFRVFDDFENQIIDMDTLAKVLTLLQNYSIRRLICEVGSNSLRGLYKTLYSRVFTRKENKEHYYDAIVSFLLQITSKDVIPSDYDFTLALKEKNLYRKNALCKYLLAAIENQGKEKVEIDELSIEHIMPQNKNLSKSWQNMLGENWAYMHDKYLHTLGNLTLTGYNSELGDRPFKDKKDMLQSSEIKTHITILNDDVLNKYIWDENSICKRAENLAKIIINLFSIEQPEDKIDFSDPRYKEYKATNPEDATYKIVNYYELLGEKVNIDSFAGMVRSVAVKLYDLDSSIIERMAQNNEKFPGWLVPVFSYDKDMVKGNTELKEGLGIYISTGYSAHDCICFIRELLKQYDLNVEEDFIYSARENPNSKTEEN